MYGVRPTGVIYGEQISRREQDMLNHTTIDETVKRIIPVVAVGMYRVTYTDVVDIPDSPSKAPKRFQVLEIRVEPGRPYQLYEDQNHEVSECGGCLGAGRVSVAMFAGAGLSKEGQRSVWPPDTSRD